MNKLRKEQHKVAKEFYQRLKENFDPDKLVVYYQAYRYMGWYFDYNDWSWLSKIVLDDNDEDEDLAENDLIRIRPSIITRLQISHFLRKQSRRKQRKSKRNELLRELEPTKLKIEETFARPTEVYEALNNGQ